MKIAVGHTAISINYSALLNKQILNPQKQKLGAEQHCCYIVGSCDIEAQQF